MLHAHRRGSRNGAFYEDCLEYAHCLWRQGRPARAILCLDRAFGADLTGEERELAAWPLPYAALAWLLRHAPEGVFLGNPRVHFQHYAGRMNEPRRELRRWRAWGCWSLTRAVLPALPPDPRQEIEEPTEGQIQWHLERLGLPGEAQLWFNVLKGRSRPRST